MAYTLKVTSVSTIETEDDVHGFAIGLKLYNGDKPVANKYKVSINTENADVPMVGVDDYGRIVGIKTAENGDDLFTISCSLEDSGTLAIGVGVSISSIYGKKAGDVLS